VPELVLVPVPELVLVLVLLQVPEPELVLVLVLVLVLALVLVLRRAPYLRSIFDAFVLNSNGYSIHIVLGVEAQIYKFLQRRRPTFCFLIDFY
jgi:hypothetical protein